MELRDETTDYDAPIQPPKRLDDDDSLSRWEDDGGAIVAPYSNSTGRFGVSHLVV